MTISKVCQTSGRPRDYPGLCYADRRTDFDEYSAEDKVMSASIFETSKWINSHAIFQCMHLAPAHSRIAFQKSHRPEFEGPTPRCFSPLPEDRSHQRQLGDDEHYEWSFPSRCRIQHPQSMRFLLSLFSMAENCRSFKAESTVRL